MEASIVPFQLFHDPTSVPFALPSSSCLAMLFEEPGYNRSVFTRLFLPLLFLALVSYAVCPRHLATGVAKFLCVVWGTAMVVLGLDLLSSYFMNPRPYPGRFNPAELCFWIVAGLATIFIGWKGRTSFGAKA